MSALLMVSECHLKAVSVRTCSHMILIHARVRWYVFRGVLRGFYRCEGLHDPLAFC